MPQPPEFAEVIALSELATAGEFSLEYDTNIFAGDNRSATSLCSNMIDAHARNTNNAAFLVASANWFRANVEALRTPPTPAGYDAGDVATASAEGFRACVASVGEWLPIDSAPKDALHIRGLWVREIRKGKPDRLDWRAFVGYVNDSGRFVDSDYDEDFGWEADDYEKWHPMPAPPAIAQPSEVGGAL